MSELRLVIEHRLLDLLDESADLLQRLPATDLCKLAAAVSPVAGAPVLPFWSSILLVMLRHELARREHKM